MDLKEKKINGETIFKGHVVTLERDKVLCPNGVESYREVVRHPGGACILGITKDEKVLMIRQFRYAYDEILYELPAGKLEVGEDPKEAAIREFEEETGYAPKKMEFLGLDYPTCGYSNEKLYLYYTNDFVKTETHFDQDEFVILEEIPLSTVIEMVKDGRIKDGKTINALFLYIIRFKKVML